MKKNWVKEIQHGESLKFVVVVHVQERAKAWRRHKNLWNECQKLKAANFVAHSIMYITK